jgi:hypothetical protein
VALALSALFVLTSGAYLEWLSALLSKVGVAWVIWVNCGQGWSKVVKVVERGSS